MLQLEDLKPSQAAFKLSTTGDKEHTLKVFSLADRIWLQQKYGKNEVESIFKEQRLIEMAEIAHHLLLDKAQFPSFMDFAGAIVTIQDNIALTQALLKTIGIDEALIKKLAKEMDAKENPNAQAPLP